MNFEERKQQAKADAKGKYKIGDRLRVIDETSLNYGKTGELFRLFEDYVSVTFDGENASFYYYADVEPVKTPGDSNSSIYTAVTEDPKVTLHKQITAELSRIYEAKNHDYGDSFNETYRKLGLISAVTRISDKVNRLQSLCTKEQRVADESIKDTLMDCANYCIMTLMALEEVEDDARN